MSAVDWSELQHAYGSAADMPALLAQARVSGPPKDYRTEPWFSLWSSLYHQDDVYTASYAAVPELVSMAKSSSPEVAAECLYLAAMIELRRAQGGAPAVPAGVDKEYTQAIEDAAPLSGELFQRVPDAEGKLEIAALVFARDYDGARAILETD